MAPTFSEHLHTAQTALRAARAALIGEISGYPAPIAGCDAQFNGLLADRRRIDNALGALGAEVFIATPRTPSRRSGVESR